MSVLLLLSDYSSMRCLRVIGCKHIPSFQILMKDRTWNLHEMSFLIIMLRGSSKRCSKAFEPASSLQQKHSKVPFSSMAVHKNYSLYLKMYHYYCHFQDTAPLWG